VGSQEAQLDPHVGAAHLLMAERRADQVRKPSWGPAPTNPIFLNRIMINHFSPISDKQAEAINGGFLNTSVSNTGAYAKTNVGQGFFVGIGSLKVKL
jgi:hypothetical protein